MAHISWLLMLLLVLGVAVVSGGRLPVGDVTERYTEGILTWDDAVGDDGAATLHVAGMLGVGCGTGIIQQTECALAANENIFSLAFDIPLEEHPLQHATLCSVYLATMDDFNDVNVVWEEFWRRQEIAVPPARVALAGSGLPADALIEVQCTGHYDGDWRTAHNLTRLDAGRPIADRDAHTRPLARRREASAKFAELQATVAAQSARLARLEELLSSRQDSGERRQDSPHSAAKTKP